MGENDYDKHGQAGQLFENFIQATTCKGTLQAFNILTRQLELDPQDHRHFYTKLKSKVTSWKAKALWNKLDKKHGQKEYKKGKACIGTKNYSALKMNRITSHPSLAPRSTKKLFYSVPNVSTPTTNKHFKR